MSYRSIFGPTLKEQVEAAMRAPFKGTRIAPVLSSGHAPDCSFRIAETCAIPFECEHGHDCCPICDPCTCGKSSSVSTPAGRASGDPT